MYRSMSMNIKRGKQCTFDVKKNKMENGKQQNKK